MSFLMNQFLGQKLGYETPEAKRNFWNDMFETSNGNTEVANQSVMEKVISNGQAPGFTQADSGETFGFDDGNYQPIDPTTIHSNPSWFDNFQNHKGTSDALIAAGASLLNGEGFGGGLNAFQGSLENTEDRAIAEEQRQFQNDMATRGMNLRENQFDYRQKRDQVGDKQWSQTFDYQQKQDAISNDQWERGFVLKEADALMKQKAMPFDIALKKAQAMLAMRKANDPNYGKTLNAESGFVDIPMQDGSTTRAYRVDMPDGTVQFKDALSGQVVDASQAKGAPVPVSTTRIIPKTGNYRWIDEQGNEQIREVVLEGKNAYFRTGGEGNGLTPIQDVLTPKELATGKQTGRNDEADVEIRAGQIPNAISFSKKSKIPSFNFQREGEQKAYSQVLRAVTAEREMNDLTLELLKTEGGLEALTSMSQKFQEWAASGANTSITKAVVNDIVGQTIPQSMQSAYKRFLQAVLRNDTGAAYTETEISDYMGAFMPSMGDTADTIRNKRDARLMELASQAGKTGVAAPYLIGLIDGDYPLPNVDYAIRQAGEPAKPDAFKKPTTQTTTDGLSLDDLMKKYQ